MHTNRKGICQSFTYHNRSLQQHTNNDTGIKSLKQYDNSEQLCICQPCPVTGSQQHFDIGTNNVTKFLITELNQRDPSPNQQLPFSLQNNMSQLLHCLQNRHGILTFNSSGYHVFFDNDDPNQSGHINSCELTSRELTSFFMHCTVASIHLLGNHFWLQLFFANYISLEMGGGTKQKQLTKQDAKCLTKQLTKW